MPTEPNNLVHQLYTPTLNEYVRPKTGSGGAFELREAAGRSVVAAALAGHLETSLVSGVNQLKKSPSGFHLTLADIFPQAEYLSLVEVPLPPGRRVKAAALKKLARLLADPSGSQLLNYQPVQGHFQLLGLVSEKIPKILTELSESGWPAALEREASWGRVEFCRGRAGCPWPLIEPARLAGRLAQALEKQGYDFKDTGLKVAVNGCGQDCLKAEGRYDLILTGTWQGELTLDSQAAFSYLNRWSEAVGCCPAGRLVMEGGRLAFNQEPCRHCGRCRRRLPQAVQLPDDLGVAVWSGGRRPLGRPSGRPRPLKPFCPLTNGTGLEEKLTDLLANLINFWFEQKDHSREFLSQTIDRLGLGSSLTALGLQAEPEHLA